MSMEICCIHGREYAVWVPENRGPFPIAVVCGGDMTEQLPALAAGHGERILISPKASWERDYTPWPAETPAGREPFSGGGPRFLEELKEAIPVIGEKHPLLPGRENRAVLGYSLDSFLMTCWTTVYPGACSTTFRGAGGAITSPPYRETVRGSVRTTSPSSPAGASLRSCPARMRRVGENTRQTAEILRLAGRFGEVPLRMENGGHFTDIPGRWQTAFCWLDEIQK
mgnify:CR=1 FL=1